MLDINYTSGSNNIHELETKISADHEKIKIWEKDNAEMVLIPKGPLSEVFYLDRYEVTNAQYLKFVEDTKHREPDFWNRPDYNQPDQPVVGVRWHDALAYCVWAGKRLPTEKEWEWAARGGLEDKKYPWGNHPPNSAQANYDEKAGKLTPIGSYSANGYGLYDMAGNVGEWCQDWYSKEQEYRVIKGGSWKKKASHLRISSRDNQTPTFRSKYVGFRCLVDVK